MCFIIQQVMHVRSLARYDHAQKVVSQVMNVLVAAKVGAALTWKPGNEGTPIYFTLAKGICRLLHVFLAPVANELQAKYMYARGGETKQYTGNAFGYW